MFVDIIPKQTCLTDVKILKNFIYPYTLIYYNLRFQFLKAVLLKNQVLSGMKSCRWVSSSRRFEGILCLRLQGQAVQEERVS
jgi:hypothetical protein